MNEPLHGNAKYDWAKLADGEWHKFTQGKQFTCAAESFRIQVQAAARSMGKRAVTRVIENRFVAFRFCSKLRTNKK